MSEVQVFTHKEFGSLRIIWLDEKIWFLGREVAAAIGYKNTADALKVRVPLEQKRVIQRGESLDMGVTIPLRGLTLITYLGVTALMDVRNDREDVHRFRQWLEDEILIQAIPKKEDTKEVISEVQREPIVTCTEEIMEIKNTLLEKEVLGKHFRVYGTLENPLFLAKDVAEWIDYSKDSKGAYNVSKMLYPIDEDEKIRTDFDLTISKDKIDFVSSTSPEAVWFLTEDGLYEVLMLSRKPIAKQFKKEVKKILKTIRKTGGYVADDDLFLDTYLPTADENTRALFKATLVTMRNQTEIIEKQKKTIEHKQEVITGFTDTITLADKRQILNRVVRYNGGDGTYKGVYRDRWSILYREFENKYHMNLQKRFDNYKAKGGKMILTKLDYIDNVLGMLPELYEVAAKVFEDDVKKLVDELYGVVKPQ